MIKSRSESSRIRTRFAPSPTGLLHMGNARTALFNYLFAKNQGGDFVLRIEDTDKERSKPEYEQDVLDNLRWLGLEWTEGVEKEGFYGPYRQSERTELYQKYLTKLLDEKKAYECFCSEEELDAQRQYQMSIGEAPRYSGKCSSLSKEETAKKKKAGEKSVIRFVVIPKEVTFEDLIRGSVTFNTALSGDIVIAKDLETPLYNFSVVIDDSEMHITHIIRGEDHISNTPKQILLQEAMGFERPIYAHLPLVLGEDRTKLSKRHGDISVTRFRDAGYLPEALVNFLALLGWNPGTEEEIFSLSALCKQFSFEKTQKAGAVFNFKRLDWINGFYLRQKSPSTLAELCTPFLEQAGLVEKVSEDIVVKETGEKLSKAIVEKIVVLYQDRLKKLSEIGELADFFFKKRVEYTAEMLSWKETPKEETKNALNMFEEIISGISESDWTKEKLENVLMPEAEKQKSRGVVLWPLRVALTGKEASAGPFEIAEILGKKRTLEYLKEAKEKLS
ncbi:MAG: glutamate--tRNA ligase [bacterium]|nr:glutamate--tRNA ligase [bacterium]